MADLFKKFGVAKTAKPGSLMMAAKAKANEEMAETPAVKKAEAKNPAAEAKEKSKTPAPKTFHGKSMKLGGGGKFAKGVASLEAKGKSKESAGAIMAAAGRAKYGAKKMAAMSAAGKK